MFQNTYNSYIFVRCEYTRSLRTVFHFQSQTGSFEQWNSIKSLKITLLIVIIFYIKYTVYVHSRCISNSIWSSRCVKRDAHNNNKKHHTNPTMFTIHTHTHAYTHLVSNKCGATAFRLNTLLFFISHLTVNNFTHRNNNDYHWEKSIYCFNF